MTAVIRLAAARLFEVAGALPADAAHAAAWPERKGLLLELEDRDGRIGQGEASPLPGFSRDALEDVRTELLRVAWRSLPELEVGSELEVGPGLEVGPDLADRLAGSLAEAGLRTPAARFAAETALLDLLGQASGLPVHVLIRHRPPEAAWRVPIAALLGTEAEAASRKVEQGYRTLKLKVGRAPSEELARLAGLRAELGEEVGLRADANRSLPSLTVEAWLAGAADLRLEFVEEPVPPEVLAGLPPSPVPLALDESLSPGDDSALARTLGAGGYRYLVLKPAYHGGLMRCLRLAAFARSSGVLPVVSHLLDGPVALAAATELALALGPGPAAGVDAHPGLSIWPAVDLPAVDRAELVPHGRPGLGLPRLAGREGAGRWTAVGP